MTYSKLKLKVEVFDLLYNELEALASNGSNLIGEKRLGFASEVENSRHIDARCVPLLPSPGSFRHTS